MMRMTTKQFMLLMAMSLAAIGCGSTKSFQLEVTNQTDRSITLWLTKDGPPAEDGWRSPEELATAAAHEGRQPSYDFAIVDPGKMAFTDKLSRTIPAGT